VQTIDADQENVANLFLSPAFLTVRRCRKDRGRQQKRESKHVLGFLTVVLLSVGSMDKGGVDTVIATKLLTENEFLINQR
jgi:hypothetical protein